MSIALIAEYLTQKVIWTFLVQFLCERESHPGYQSKPAIRIEDLRAYGNADGLRELMTEAGLDERQMAVLIYRYNLHRGWSRGTWREIGQLLPEPISAQKASWISVQASGQIQRFLVKKKSDQGFV